MPAVRDAHNLRKVSLLINCRVNNAPPHGMHTFASRGAYPSVLSFVSLKSCCTLFLFSSERAATALAFAYFFSARGKARRIEISHVISHFRRKKLFLRLALTLLRRELLSVENYLLRNCVSFSLLSHMVSIIITDSLAFGIVVLIFFSSLSHCSTFSKKRKIFVTEKIFILLKIGDPLSLSLFFLV